MARKLSRSKRKALGITITPHEGMWISYQIRRSGIEQQDIAVKAGVSPALVSKVLHGKKNSERVKSALVAALGFEAWEKLIAKARRASREGVAA